MQTMGDVARLAKVSVATVSAVINENKKVSTKLKEKVRAAIRALDYHPDHIARSLRVRRTFTVGVIVPNVSSMFFAEVFRGIEDVARNHGYSAILCVSDEDAVQERHQLGALLSRRVDGILLATADAQAASHWPRGRDLALVLIDRLPPGSEASAVVVDNTKAACEATRHLASALAISVLPLSPGRWTGQQLGSGWRASAKPCRRPATRSSGNTF